MSTAAASPSPATTTNQQAPSQAQPQAAQSQAAATPAEIRKMKLKLDGQEVELSENEVIEYAQQGRAASKRFDEAARLRKEADEIMKYAKENPEEFFKKTGLDPEAWAEKYLMEVIQKRAESPEQRRARENEEKLRKFESEEKSRKDQERQAQIDRMTNEKRAEIEQVFIKALNESGLPKTPYTVKRMAELQLLNIKNKYELSASQLAKLVREDYAAEQKSLIGALDGDQLIEFLGEETVKKLSKAQISKLKSRGNLATSQSRTGTQPRSSEGKELDWNEYQRRNRGRR